MNEIVFLCVIALSAMFCCGSLAFKKPEKALQCKERGKTPLERLKAIKAFSLVEMLMALLVASLLLAALAPVMTKKLSEPTINIGDVSKKNNAEGTCTFEELMGQNGQSCSVPPWAKVVGVIVASAGGGGGAGVIGDYSATTADIPSNGILKLDGTMRNVIIELTGAGGGGGGGNYSSSGVGEPTSQSDCGDWGVFVSASQNGGKAVCVSRYNPSNTGDGKATPKSNISGVTNVNVGSSCSGGNCCWNGATSTTCQSSGNGFTYSGCNRTVCQWNAANTICANWKPTGSVAGRLPTQAELAAWAPHIKYVSSTKSGVLNQPNGTFPGLQLCDRYSGYGALQCQILSGGCPGSEDGYCYPYSVWSGTAQSSSYYYGYYLRSGTFNEGYTVPTHARGVRCVLETTSSFSPYSGGGGGGGAYVKLKIPKDVIARATQNNTVGTLTMTAGTGGGGAAGGNPNAYGTAGGYSVASVTDSTGAEIWRLEVPGGSGGKGAKVDGGGTPGGSGGQVASCRYKNIVGGYSALTTVNCSSLPDVEGAGNGETGKAGGDGIETNNSLTMGRGGKPAGNGGPVGTNSAAGVSSTEGSVSIDAPTATTPGGGGGGGGAQKVGATPTPGKGGRGADGKFKGTYEKVALCGGAGGGGGGAGALLHVRFNAHNSAIQQKTIEITEIGEGGGGAIAGNNPKGTDGGPTTVVIAGNIVIKANGGGGGATATRCNASATPVSVAVPGAAGAAGDAFSGTKNWLNTNANKLLNDPVILTSSPAATSAPAPSNTGAIYYDKAAGGNGGLVQAIGVHSSYPCGGFSTLPEGTCSVDGINPVPPKITTSDRTPPAPEDFQVWLLDGGFAAGSSGGSGGAWTHEGGDPEGIGKASNGAAGMNGYAYVYFE